MTHFYELCSPVVTCTPPDCSLPRKNWPEWILKQWQCSRAVFALHLLPQFSVSEPWLSWKHSQGAVGSPMCLSPQHLSCPSLSQRVFAVERVGTSQHICTPVPWPLSALLLPGLAGRTQGKPALTTQSHGFLKATLSLTSSGFLWPLNKKQNPSCPMTDKKCTTSQSDPRKEVDESTDSANDQSILEDWICCSLELLLSQAHSSPHLNSVLLQNKELKPTQNILPPAGCTHLTNNYWVHTPPLHKKSWLLSPNLWNRRMLQKFPGSHRRLPRSQRHPLGEQGDEGA